MRSPGLGNTGMLGTLIIMGGLIVTMFALLLGGWKGGASTALVALALFTAFGTPAGRWCGTRIAYWHQVNKREHQWRSGMFSRNKDHEVRLPGMLGKTTLLSKTDAFGNEFAVIQNPRKGGLYTVVARCTAEGPALQDQHRIDIWVSNWGGVLASMGQEHALICGKAITDTAPDPGGRLAALVHSSRSDEAPTITREVMEECLATYPAASSENVTYIEMVFRGRDLNKRGQEEAILTELARKVPSILGQVQLSGGGAVEMLGPNDLPKVIRAAYDPGAARFIEAAELAGLDTGDANVAWKDAGPVAEQAFWDHLVHDSGRSVTWEMIALPRAAITELAMSNLLRPHNDFVRKRVALIYRPHSPEQSTKVSETDANTAMFNAKTTKKRITALAEVSMKSAEQARQEVAYGAALVRFALMITATVGNGDDLGQAAATIESLAGSIPLRLRRCYGTQSSAFAATLPVGFVPWEHTTIPTKVRELM